MYSSYKPLNSTETGNHVFDAVNDAISFSIEFEFGGESKKSDCELRKTVDNGVDCFSLFIDGEAAFENKLATDADMACWNQLHEMHRE